MNDTTTKMRELLARWAEVEPARCRVETLPDNLVEFLVTYGGGTFIVFTSTNAGCRYWRTENDSLMRIQWSVQEAIVARGWVYNLVLSHDPKGYYASVRAGGIRGEGASDVNPAEALLSAYLEALEESQ